VFNWIVGAINAKLDMGKKGSGRFIAILDIYGFEQFQVNRWVCVTPKSSAGCQQRHSGVDSSLGPSVSEGLAQCRTSWLEVLHGVRLEWLS
jgi:hypothetical protein